MSDFDLFLVDRLSSEDLEYGSGRNVVDSVGEIEELVVLFGQVVDVRLSDILINHFEESH